MKYKLAADTVLTLLLASTLITTLGITPFKDALTQSVPENEGIMVSSYINVPVYQRGMSYASWPPNFDSANSDESLRLLRLTNTEWVAICVFWYQENITTAEIYPSYNTPSNSSVIQAINRCHELGMKVMLKPMVDPLDGNWRGLIPPSTEWFASYTNFIDFWAEFSQENRVDMLCVGCEFYSNDGQTASWENIVGTVRQRYSGPITYAASGGLYQNVHWWGSMDYVGIDAYFPLTNKSNPTVEELKAGWSPLVEEMSLWQATVNKPIIFTEIGYRSADGANEAPSDYSTPMSIDLQEQVDCYNATFQTFSDKSWFYGFYWWNWETSPYAGGNSDTGYTPQNKPVESLITSRYAFAHAFQGDLVLTDNDVAVIEGNFDINGSIVVEGNATLVLRNAVLNFTQTEDYQFNMTFRSPANGNPRLQAENMSITASDHYFYMSFLGNSSAIGYNITSNYNVMLWTYDNSVMSISNSSGIAASALQDSVLTIDNSTISMVSCYDSSEVYIYNSEITEAAVIGTKTINCTISKLGPGFFSYWSFITNSSPTIPPGEGAPNITLNNTSVSNWSLHASGSSNIMIADAVFLIIYALDSSHVSMIDSTVTDSISLGGTSVVSLVNSTYSSANYDGTASIQVAWYLDVQVMDSTDQEVKAANVTAIYPNATMAGWKLTDEKGGARLALVEKVANATGDYPVGNYTVEATYASYSNETTMNMTQNWQVALPVAGLVIPEFPSPLFMTLLMILTLVGVVAYKRKSARLA